MDALELSKIVLNAGLGLLVLFYIFRIVLTWYPQIELTKFPYSLVAIPTEPLLIILRKIVPPLAGIDITPVIGVGIFSLLREMLLGQQGILTML